MGVKQIRGLITRDLSKPIEEIIKVEQADEQSVYTEITEYVATGRLREQYREVLRAMADYPKDPHEGVGVWVSGFFGSGKSSFAKNLGYALANKPILGKPAAEVFKAQIGDHAVADYLDLVNVRTPSEVVMFDVSVNRPSGITAGASLSSYMYAALLRALDYADDFDIAELEQTLEADGRLEDFIARFERGHRERFEKQGARQQIEREQWKWSVRRKLAEKLNEASAVLHEMDRKTYPQADSWARAQGARHMEISPALLADKTLELASRRRPGKGIVYIVDEVGSYVARNTERIEDLRAIVETLGKQSKNRVKARSAVGPVWVIVTSQEKLDDVVGAIDGKRTEIARVQDRFKTRVDLAPADIREVATRRVLAKKPEGITELDALYAKHMGQIEFSWKLERSTRRVELSREKFAEFYPYPPHFVDLSIEIMSGIRLAPGGMRQLGGSNRTIIRQAHQVLVSERTQLAEAEVGRLVTLDLIFELVEGNIASEKQRDISEIGERFGAASWEARVAKAICLLEFVRDLPRTEGNLAAVLVDRVGGFSPTLEVHAALEKLQAAQFVRNTTEDGYKLQTLGEKDWQTERESLDPKPRERVEARRAAIEEIFKEKSLRSYNCKGLRAFRVGLSVDGVKLESGDVPLVVRVADSTEELAARCAEVQGESRQKEHTRESFWVFASTPEIEETVTALCRSKQMVLKYDQLRGQGNITNDQRSCLVGERDEVTRLQGRLRELLSAAIQGGTGYIEGNAKESGELLGRTHEETLQAFFEVAVPRLYSKLEMGFRPLKLKGTEADEVLKAANLGGLAQVLYEGTQGLGLVVKEGTKYVPNTSAEVAREILNHLKYRSAYGEKVSGRDLEQVFTAMPYGWERDLLMVTLAVLLRAGAVEVTHQGRRFRGHQDAQSRVPLTSTHAFKAASFSPRESVGLKTLTTAADYLEQLTGEEVEIEEVAITQAFKKLCAEAQGALLPVLAKAKAFGLPAAAVLEEHETALRGILESASDDCVRTLAGEGRTFKESMERARRIGEALEGPAFDALRAAQRALEHLWPVVRDQDGFERQGLVEELSGLVEDPAFYEHTPRMVELTGTIQQAYGEIYDQLHERRQSVIERESDLVKNKPEWPTLAEEVRLPLLAPLSNRGCGGLERAPGVVVCEACHATVPQMDSDIVAAPALRAGIVAKLQQLAAPEKRVARLRMAELCPKPLEKQEDVEAFVAELTSQLMKLLAEGASIVVE